MRFLVDAQLPRRVVTQLRHAGFEAIHTLDPAQRQSHLGSGDHRSSIKDHYIVVTKDSDFVETFLLLGVPWKLLLVSTGNIDNPSLEALFSATMLRMARAFDDFDFIELAPNSLIFHI